MNITGTLPSDKLPISTYVFFLKPNLDPRPACLYHDWLIERSSHVWKDGDWLLVGGNSDSFQWSKPGRRERPLPFALVETDSYSMNTFWKKLKLFTILRLFRAIDFMRYTRTLLQSVEYWLYWNTISRSLICWLKLISIKLNYFSWLFFWKSQGLISENKIPKISQPFQKIPRSWDKIPKSGNLLTLQMIHQQGWKWIKYVHNWAIRNIAGQQATHGYLKLFWSTSIHLGTIKYNPHNNHPIQSLHILLTLVVLSLLRTPELQYGSNTEVWISENFGKISSEGLKNENYVSLCSQLAIYTIAAQKEL